MKTISVTEASRQACSESSLYRQGQGWIMSAYDEQFERQRTTAEMPRAVAVVLLRRERIERALVLLGWDRWTAQEAAIGWVPAGKVAQIVGAIERESRCGTLIV